ncbi:MAG: hypothetical protein KJ927_13850 [Candidatus Eisenbacteria bacterium]|nr:hypothetical protein [Candidatus Eisenbacteria bacterium]MBU1949792.1 hypothetical protein [Candidatus Eisenbacteria bacterium]
MKVHGHWLAAGAALALICLLLLPNQVEARYLRGGEEPAEARNVAQLYAIRPPNLFYHNVGLLELLVTNIGIIGNPFGLDSFGAGWRGGEFLYAASIWVGAVASDNLSYVSTGAYSNEFLPEPDPIETIYPSFEGVLGGNRIGFSTTPDDDGDGFTDEDFHNGKDDDRDGLTDEDFEAISQQMFSCEYKDNTERAIDANPEHRPLNLLIQQRSFAWSTPGSNEFIGFEFTIWNDGFETLRDVFIGFFVDSDAGPRDAESYWTDDGGAYLDLDTLFVDPARSDSCAAETLNIEICYMYDIPDNGQTATGGDIDGFFGGMFMGHTTDPNGVFAPAEVGIYSAAFFSSSAPYPEGDPRNDFERYDLLSSGNKPTRPTTQPSDYRYAFSAGPFAELLPGENLMFQTAFVIGSGRGGMARNAVNAQRIYNGIWRDVDDRADTGIDGKETCLIAIGPGEPARWSDPCTDLSPPRVIKETECIPTNYVDNDCDGCTPDPLCIGCETLVHWVGSVAPPSPNTNMDEPDDPTVRVHSPSGHKKVIIEWDNASELAADPISGKILWAGYKVYQARDWNRPTGSIGPAPDDWQVVFEITKDPKDNLGEDSPNHIVHFTDTTVTSPYSVLTGAGGPDSIKAYYPVGRYKYEDTEGLHNGMLYFYDVTAYSTIPDTLDPGNPAQGIEPTVAYYELESRPTAVEAQAVVPTWSATSSLDDIYVVPNPYVRGGQPASWDLNPSDTDPTGTKIAFANLPKKKCEVSIYTMAGDLVQTLNHDPMLAAELGRESDSGTVFWNLITRNGQDVVSGVYLYSVKCGSDTKVGRFVIIR